MAKERRTKLIIDSKSAVTAVNNLTDTIVKYNRELNKNRQQVRFHTDTTRKATQQIANFKDEVRSLRTNVRHLTDSVDILSVRSNQAAANIRSLRDVSRGAASRIESLRVNARNASFSLGSLAIQSEKFRDRLHESTSALRRENTQIEHAVTNLRSFNTSLRTVTANMDKKNNALITQTAKLREDALAARYANEQYKNVAISWRTVARVIFATAVHRAVLRFTQSLIHATEKSIDFSIVIEEIQTISDRAAVSTDRWANSLKNLSDNYGIDTLEVAEAAYQALSNQVVNAGETTQFLREEIRLSVIAASDLDKAVGTTTAVLNAYGLGVDRTRYVNDLLFATVERGRLRLEDMANTMGRLAVLSSELGVSFEEQEAAIALLTRRGITAEQTFTLLRQLELKLIKPTETMSQLFEKFGVTSGESAIKTFGLIGILEKIKEEASKNGDAMAELGDIYGRVRALIAAVGLTSADYRGELLELRKAAQDTDEDFKKSMESFGRRAKIQIEQVKNYFLSLGDLIGRELTATAEAAGGARKAIEFFFTIIFRGTQLILTYKLAVSAVAFAERERAQAIARINAALVEQNNLQQASLTTMQKWRIGLAAALPAVAFLGLEIVGVIARLKELSIQFELAEAEGRNASYVFSESVLAGQIRESQNAFQELGDSVDYVQKQFNQTLASLRSRLNSFSFDVEKTAKATKEAIEILTTSPLSRIEETIDSLKDKIRELKSISTGGRAGLEELKFSSRIDAFEGGLAGKTEEDRLKALATLKVELNREAEELIRKDDIEGAKRRFDEIARIQDELIRTKTAEVDSGIDKTKRKSIRTLLPDPFSKKGYRIGTVSTEVSDTAAREKARASLEEVNKLVAERTKLVERRIKLESEFLDRTESRERKLTSDAKAKEDALIDLRKRLAEIDTFDFTKKGAKKEFSSLVGGIDPLASAAGLSSGERVNLLRAANAQRILLEREAAEETAKARIDAVQKEVDAQIDGAKEVIKIRGEAEEKFRRQIQTSVNEIDAVAAKFKEVFKDVSIGTVDSLTGLSQVPSRGTRQTSEVGATLQQLDINLQNIARANESFLKEGNIQNFNKLNEEYAKLLETIKKIDVFTAEGKLARRISLFGLDSSIGIPLQPLGGSTEIAKDKFGREQTTQNQAERIQRELSNLRDAVKEYTKAQKIANEVEVDFEGLKNEINQLPTVINSLGVTVKNFTQIMKGLNDSTRRAEIELKGGVPTFNFGGRATDRTPAFLSPGETVLTRGASERLAPVIQQAERAAGLSGGTTITFGDINLSVPQGTSTTQAMAVVDEINRLSRLGLINIGRN